MFGNGPPHDNLMPYARFVEGATSQTGLFTIWRKQGRVYFEIAPGQLDHPYLLTPIVASGVGKGLFAGLHLRDVLWKFHRVEDQILSIEANPYAKVTQGTPSALAVAISFPESIVSSDGIVSVNDDNGHMVFPADALFSDIGYLSDAMSILGGNQLAPRYGLNRGLSYWGPTKAFPKNVDLETDLTLSGQGSIDTVPDPRSVFVRLHYSILELPNDGYQPRYADDRVGFFITARRQFDTFNEPDDFVRYINRWNVQKSDPSARSSPAKQPIVYYLSNDIPTQYRGPIRRALLTWNKAFEAVGITHAIQVRQQPKDPNWDPDDIRYSVVRWIVTADPLFAAAAPTFVNPLNGQIIRADLIIDGNTVRAGHNTLRTIVDPAHALNAVAHALSPSGSLPALPGAMPALTGAQALACGQNDCDYGEQMAAQQEWAEAVLISEGRLPGAQRLPDWFINTYLTAIVLHESGHTLGLRHNFQSSTVYSLAQIHNARFTQAHGLSGSVMDYTPVNISPRGQPQGSYFQTVLGPWDYFTIKYGYEPMSKPNPDAELPALRALAAQTTKRELSYATDEDNAWDIGLATDPRVNQFDLSADPIAYTANVLSIDQHLFNSITQRLPRKGQSYAESRRTFRVLLSNWWTAARLATHYIGGEYFTRNHRGDPNAHLPFTPVPRSEEKRAFALLDRYVLSDGAYQFSPALINSLGDDRFLHWESNPNQLGRLDFPVDEYVETYQVALLAEMWQPSVLARLAGLESRVSHPGDTMSLADLYDWTDASMWGDLNGRVQSVPRAHRSLQHFYAELLTHIMLKPDSGTPNDARTLARHHLSWLRDRLSRALQRGGYDEATTANFEDMRTLVDRALAANVTFPAW